MKQIVQNYKSGELSLVEVPAPTCRPGGVLVRSQYSLISVGTEMMKISESKLSLVWSIVVCSVFCAHADSAAISNSTDPDNTATRRIG